MNNLRVFWGATLALTLTNDEDGADEATLTISLSDDEVFTKTVSFVDNEADLTMTADETQITPGIYDYMISVTYDDGTVEKYPDISNCTECELPTIEICDTNDNLEVS